MPKFDKLRSAFVFNLEKTRWKEVLAGNFEISDPVICSTSAFVVTGPHRAPF
jgi:hypothetical protein